MFDQLVSSKVKRQAAPVRGLVVGMLHGILIAGAIRATARPPQAAAVDPVPITIIYEHHPMPVTTIAPLDPSTATEPIAAPALPPAPVDVPVGIPAVAPGPLVDPNVLRHILSTGTPGSDPVRGDSVSIRGVLAATEVDDPAVVVHQPSPRYPPLLQQAGIEGRVLWSSSLTRRGTWNWRRSACSRAATRDSMPPRARPYAIRCSDRPGFTGVRCGNAPFNRSRSGSRRSDDRR